jgi:hypothetical protein
VVTLFVISGKLSIPALRSLIISRQVPQPRLAERDLQAEKSRSRPEFQDAFRPSQRETSDDAYGIGQQSAADRVVNEQPQLVRERKVRERLTMFSTRNLS